MLQYVKDRAPNRTSISKLNEILPTVEPKTQPIANWIVDQDTNDETPSLTKPIPTPAPAEAPKRRRPRHLRVDPNMLPEIDENDTDDLPPRGAHAAPIIPKKTEEKRPNQERITANGKSKTQEAATEQETNQTKEPQTNQEPASKTQEIKETSQETAKENSIKTQETKESSSELKTILAVDEATAETITTETLDTSTISEPENTNKQPTNDNINTGIPLNDLIDRLADEENTSEPEVINIIDNEVDAANDTSYILAEEFLDTEPVASDDDINGFIPAEIILEDVSINPPDTDILISSDTSDNSMDKDSIDTENFDVNPVMSSDEPLTKTPFVTNIKPISIPDTLKLGGRVTENDIQKDAAFIEMILSGDSKSTPMSLDINSPIETSDITEDITEDNEIESSDDINSTDTEAPIRDIEDATIDIVDKQPIIDDDKDNQPASVTIATFKNTNSKMWYPPLCKIEFETTTAATQWTDTMIHEARNLIDTIQRLTRHHGVLIEITTNDGSTITSYEMQIGKPINTINSPSKNDNNTKLSQIPA